jgi:predicted dehydrogenase
VSCSYGPGRYDPDYEEGGHDYPVGFVRWTAQRNFEAVLDMMADGRLDVKPLISHRFAVERAQAAYNVLGGAEPSLGILLEYPGGAPASNAAERESRVKLQRRGRAVSPRGSPTVAFIGSGNYAGAVLIPAFKAAGARLVSVASSTGLSGMHVGRRYGFEETTTDADALFTTAGLDVVVVATRHDSHARFVVQALAAGKHVFVEKPLCLSVEELARIETEHARVTERGPAPLVMVGFNRRFAPQILKMKTLLASVPGPKAFVITVNAGAIPPGHWTQSAAIGGGRIKGEACHFIDLLRFLAGSPFVSQGRLAMESATGDTASLHFGFADGSIGSVHYFANGSTAFPKERVEVFAQGRVLQLDNFRRMRGFGWPGFSQLKLWRQDKGQQGCAAAFLEAIRRGEPSPIPFDEILEVSRVTIALA